MVQLRSDATAVAELPSSDALPGAPGGAPTGAQPRPLDLHEGISTPAPGGCARWPVDFWLRNTFGELVRGRCKATNLCAYCARLAAVENSELLALDALHGIAPSVWVVLTTPSADPDPSTFYRSREKLMKALRRRFPGLQYAALVEFTTGYGTHSGGLRRPHWNLLLKGVTVDDIPTVRELVERVWCARVGGDPDAQHVGSIEEMGGLMRYVALHFQKESQAPPEGWRGHRFMTSHGYLWTDREAAREAARQSLRLGRELRKAHAAGLEGEAALEAAHLARYEANELAWELVRETRVPGSFGSDGLPTDWQTTYAEVRP